MVVGFLGLGAIGTPMAARLAPRWPLTVWNRTAVRAAEFASRFGPDGILAGLAGGALFLDCTSGDPAASRRIADRLALRGVAADPSSARP